jgi:hypothetical protein
MGMIAKVFDEQGVRYAGGAIMHGSEWHTGQFILDDDLFFNALPREAKARWNSTFERCRSGKSNNYWVITNIGSHMNAILSKQAGIITSPQTKIAPNGSFSITADDLIMYLNSVRQKHFSLIKKLVEAGFNLVWVSDPLLYGADLSSIQLHIEQLFGKYLAAIGCSVFLAGEWTEKMGGFKPDFRSTEIDSMTGKLDTHHGSSEYYRQLVKAVFDRFSIKPQYRQVD